MTNYLTSSWLNIKRYQINSTCWLDLFHQHVANHPQKTALYYHTDTISYSTLNETANAFTSEILKQCTDDDKIIGVFMNRTPAMVAALIAVHKAGKAYLPLDTTYPVQRINHMIRDSGTRLILTDQVNSIINHINSPQTINFIQTNQPIKPNLPFTTKSKTTNIAYLIYTSGSAGTPKGIIINHGALLNFLMSMKDEPGCTSEDIVLALTTTSFDISVLELFLPLISGASIYLADETAIYNPDKLIQTLSSANITLIQTTPTVWKLLLDAGFTGNRNTRILCGGETMSMNLANDLFNTGCDVWNMYGPTETTVWSSIYHIQSPRSSAPPIGMPIANTGLHILDQNKKPVKKGEKGELYISGAGLAEGYWNNQLLTESLFTRLPEDGNLRIYKTGDLVIENENGMISFVGRQDTQVKIRGLRIELGEIEQAVKNFSGIDDAVVLIKNDPHQHQILVAYYTVNKPAAPISTKDLRAYLSETLPGYMIPAYFKKMNIFPRTPNHKINRNAFPEIDFENNKKHTAESKNLKKFLFGLWTRYLDRSDFSTTDNFFDIGGHSLLIIQMTRELTKYLNREINPMFFFENPTIDTQYNQLSDNKKTDRNTIPSGETPVYEESDDDQLSLAIIGMSCAVPGAENVDEFWQMLQSAKSGIKEYTEDELLAAGLTLETIHRKDYVRKAGPLPSAKYFDSSFFGYSPKEAMFMDPQHRLMLEHCYKTLESAGLISTRFDGKIGVFAGAGQNQYLLKNIIFSKERDNWSDFQTMISSDNDFIATRVAYKNNLTGPAISVQTSCSSSLVAIHLAHQSLLAYQCDAALCGGVSLSLPLEEGYLHSQHPLSSPDGKCRAFDAEAEGTLFGSGIGVVLLKRLKDAIHDKDPILAILRSSAVNNDGSSKLGFTSPAIQGQCEVIQEALSLASLTSSQISYVEAHGTGTKLGDPVEIKALTKAFADSGNRNVPCYIGSVKTNIGHLDAASGIIGLIKTVLALKHKKIPASLHFKSPNPEMNIEKTPFKINTQLRDWSPINGRWLAGVSSFGIGGTNAHIILESSEEINYNPVTENNFILYPVSAKSLTALKAYHGRLKQSILKLDKADRLHAAYTLTEGRNTFPYRSFFILPEISTTDPDAKSPVLNDPKTVFLLPGHDCWKSQAGKDLYAGLDQYQINLDQCLNLICTLTDWDPVDFVFSLDVSDAQYTYPLQFAKSWALAKTLIDYGVSCDMLMGHGLGEYVAACLAGTFSLADGLKLAIHLGEYTSSHQSHKTIAAFAPAEKIKRLLPDEFRIKEVNAPDHTVIIAPPEEISGLENNLSDCNIAYTRLPDGSSFGCLPKRAGWSDFSDLLDTINFNPTQRPVMSNLTGEIMPPGYLYTKTYWLDQLQNPLLFQQGIKSIDRSSDLLFIEIGSGSKFSNFINTSLSDMQKTTIQTQPDYDTGHNEEYYFIRTLGNLWIKGLDIPLKKINKIRDAQCISLPTYPFARTEHWIYPDNKNNLSTDKQTTETTSSPPSDQTDLKTELTGIWKNVLGYNSLDSKQNFFDLGGDSLLAAELLSQINKKFNINLQFKDILTHPELKGITGIIRQSLNSPQQQANKFPYLFPVQEKGSLPPLFLISGRHENRYYSETAKESDYQNDFLRNFFNLFSNLDKNQPIYGFQPKGISFNEKPHTTVEEMASAYIIDLKKIQPQGPYQICGDCIGGSVAYEIAQQLSANGDEIQNLILIDTVLPSLSISLKEEFNLHKSRLAMIVKRIDSRPIMKAMISEISRLIKIYFSITKKQKSNIHVIENNLFYQRILLRYKTQKFNGKTTLIVNETWQKRNPDLGWNKSILPNLNVHVVPGNHRTRFTDHVETTGIIINDTLKAD